MSGTAAMLGCHMVQEFGGWPLLSAGLQWQVLLNGHAAESAHRRGWVRNICCVGRTDSVYIC